MGVCGRELKDLTGFHLYAQFVGCCRGKAGIVVVFFVHGFTDGCGVYSARKLSSGTVVPNVGMVKGMSVAKVVNRIYFDGE